MLGHDLTPETCCWLRTIDGRYVAYRQKSGFYLSRTKGAAWFQTLATHGGKLRLRCAHGPYLCATPEGRVEAAETPSDWETFTPVGNDPARRMIRSCHGTWLAAGKDSEDLEFTESVPRHARWIELVSAYSADGYQHSVRASTPAEKVVWAFWHSGQSSLCPFYALNVRTWRQVLGSEWQILVLNNVRGDPHNIHRFIDAKQLPTTFRRLPPVVQSDAVRLALLSTYGGVWMDVGIILLSPLDDFCWNDMSADDSRTLLAGFFNSGWGSDHLARRDAFENWFIATRARNAFMDRWRQTFVDYWRDRTASEGIDSHPMFESVDLSNFHRYGLDFRNYLTSHVAFRKVLEDDPQMFSLWAHNMQLRDAAEGPFLLPTLVGWNGDAVRNALVGDCDDALLERLVTTDLIKFTGSMASGVSCLSEAALTDSRSTLGKLYSRVFA